MADQRPCLESRLLKSQVPRVASYVRIVCQVAFSSRVSVEEDVFDK